MSRRRCIKAAQNTKITLISTNFKNITHNNQSLIIVPFVLTVRQHNFMLFFLLFLFRFFTKRKTPSQGV